MIESVQELTGDIATNQTLTGELDYRVTGGKVDDVKVNGTSVVENKVANIDLTGKQDVLVSGTNIKTINNESILGSGNIEIKNDDAVKYAKWQFPNNNAKITDTNALKDIQTIMNEYRTNNVILGFIANGYILQEINLLNSSQSNDYRRYELVFYSNSIYNLTRNRIYQKQMYIYTHYDTSVIYDDTDANYYPKMGSTLVVTSATTSDLNNYLHKQNTTAYTPTSDYNPATKKYVDDQVGNINSVLATLTTPGGN